MEPLHLRPWQGSRVCLSLSPGLGKQSFHTTVSLSVGVSLLYIQLWLCCTLLCFGQRGFFPCLPWLCWQLPEAALVLGSRRACSSFFVPWEWTFSLLWGLRCWTVQYYGSCFPQTVVVPCILPLQAAWSCPSLPSCCSSLELFWRCSLAFSGLQVWWQVYGHFPPAESKLHGGRACECCQLQMADWVCL